jgi:hypothetical protein
VSDRNKAVARHYIEEVWNQRNHSAIDETHHAESYCASRSRRPLESEHAPGTDAVKNMAHFYQDSFSDIPPSTMTEWPAAKNIPVNRLSAGERPCEFRVTLSIAARWSGSAPCRIPSTKTVTTPKALTRVKLLLRS